MDQNSPELPTITEQSQEYSKFHSLINRGKQILGRVALVLSLASSGIAISPAEEASAETGGYPYPNALCQYGDAGGSQCANPQDPTNKYNWYMDEVDDDKYSGYSENISPYGYYYRNCTDYAAWRVNKEFGKNISGWGNANNWDYAAARAGYDVDNSPEVGDLAIWEYNHVEFVESVNPDGSVNTSGYNQAGTGKFLPRSNVRADHYIDIDGQGSGGSSGGAGTGGSLRTNYAVDDVLDTVGTSAGWRVSKEAAGGWDYNFLNSARMKDTLLVGDFNNDGRINDILDTTGTSTGWRVSRGAGDNWDYSYRNSERMASSLLVGDFDQDGYLDDVLDATGTGWRVSRDGKDGWDYSFRGSARTKNTLLVGDFDNDGFVDDILDATGDPNVGFRVSIDGKGAWDYSYLNTARMKDTLLVGDFDRDGYFDDILDTTGTSTGWRVSRGAGDNWDYSFRDSDTVAANLAVGDFDDDGYMDDIFNATGSSWRISVDAKNVWQPRKGSARMMGTLLLGDFS